MRVPQRVGSSLFPPGKKPSMILGFHLIGFPSEWGDSSGKLIIVSGRNRFPFNWVPQRVGRSDYCLLE